MGLRSLFLRLGLETHFSLSSLHIHVLYVQGTKWFMIIKYAKLKRKTFCRSFNKMKSAVDLFPKANIGEISNFNTLINNQVDCTINKNTPIHMSFKCKT